MQNPQLLSFTLAHIKLFHVFHSITLGPDFSIRAAVCHFLFLCVIVANNLTLYFSLDLEHLVLLLLCDKVRIQT